MKKMNTKYHLVLSSFLRKLRVFEESKQDHDKKKRRPPTRLEAMKLWLVAYDTGKKLPKEAMEFFAISLRKHVAGEEKRLQKQMERRKIKDVGKQKRTWTKGDREHLGEFIAKNFTIQKKEMPDEEPHLEVAFWEFYESLQANGRTVEMDTMRSEYHKQRTFYERYIAKSKKSEALHDADPAVMQQVVTKKDNN